MSSSKKATFSGLAKLANVSAATVSRIAAGNYKVDPEIRARVQRIAAEMGIPLNKRKDSSRMLAFVLANRSLVHSFQTRVLIGAENYASSHGWELVFVTHRYPDNVPTEEVQLPPILSRNSPVRGVILAGVNTLNFVDALAARHIPFCILGNSLDGAWEKTQYDVVSSDDVNGAYEMVRYLITCGHRNIWFIGNTRYPWFSRSFRGYERAMLAANLKIENCQIQSDGRELGYLGMKSILATGKPVDAIFAGTDHTALGVYEAMREAGLSIPQDISVVVANDSGATSMHPSLTSVREFPEELGRHLVDFTVRRIKDTHLPTQRIMIPTQLVHQSSHTILSRDHSSLAKTRRQV